MSDSNGPNWDPVIWERIREGMRDEVAQAAPVSTLLPHMPVDASVTVANVDFFDEANGRVAQDYTVPMVELATAFALTDEQILREETHAEGRSAATSRARNMAHAVSLVLLQGECAVPEEFRPDYDEDRQGRRGPAPNVVRPSRRSLRRRASASGIPWLSTNKDWHVTDALAYERELETIEDRIRYVCLRVISDDEVDDSAGQAARGAFVGLPTLSATSTDEDIARAVNTHLGRLGTYRVTLGHVQAFTRWRFQAFLFNDERLTDDVLQCLLLYLEVASQLASTDADQQQQKLKDHYAANPTLPPDELSATIDAYVEAKRRAKEATDTHRELKDELGVLWKNYEDFYEYRAQESQACERLRQTWPDGVRVRSGTGYAGLMQYARDYRTIPVPPVAPGGVTSGAIRRYHLNLIDSLNRAIDALLDKDHFGPYALLLHPSTYADAHTPLENSRIRPVDMLPPDIEHFSSSRALDKSQGILISLGGNGVDVASPSQDYALEFLRVDHRDRFRFRMRTRLALRVKREGMAVALEFLEQPV